MSAKHPSVHAAFIVSTDSQGGEDDEEDRSVSLPERAVRTSARLEPCCPKGSISGALHNPPDARMIHALTVYGL